MAQQDSFGDRMKAYEALDTGRKAFKGQPIVARLDGKGFHTFCKGLTRPFDVRLHKLMRQVTGSLVERFGANIGFTQSDEITLVWVVDSTSQSEYVFDGRFQKMDSLLAAFASSIFNRDQSRLDHVVIVGGGNVGLHVAKVLEKESHIRVRLIERSAERANKAVAQVKRSIVIQGDGLNPDILAEGGVDRADFVIAITDDDKTNLLISNLAKRAGAKRAQRNQAVRPAMPCHAAGCGCGCSCSCGCGCGCGCSCVCGCGCGCGCGPWTAARLLPA
jgi:hypothetical protein